MTEIIVIGTNHHNTLSVLRSLGKFRQNQIGDIKLDKEIKSNSFNYNLILVCKTQRPYVKYSKYVTTCTIVDNEKDIPSVLISKYKMKDKAIVIACSDGIASVLDTNYNELSNYFILPGSNKEGYITTLMDKGLMSKLAVESGLKIPDSVDISTSDISETFLQKLSYPCITKPLISKNGSKSDIFIFNNPQEFKDNLYKIRSEKIQIQAFIQKDIEYQLIGCSLDGGKNVIIPGASVLLRQPPNTNTGFLKYIPNFQADFSSCKKFLKAANFSGLFSMEFLRDKNGSDYFMEINFRNDGNAICVTASGMNLPLIWVGYNLGMDISSYIRSCKMKEVLVMPEFNDIKHVFNRKISIFHWLKDVYQTDCFMEFCKSDQKPFWVYLVQKIFRIK